MAPRAGCPVTAQQLRIFRLLADGHTTKSAGQELGIARETVRVHVQHAFKRLGVHTIAQAVAVLGRTGWLDWQRLDLSADDLLALYLREWESIRWPHEPDLETAEALRALLRAHKARRDRERSDR